MCMSTNYNVGSYMDRLHCVYEYHVGSYNWTGYIVSSNYFQNIGLTVNYFCYHFKNKEIIVKYFHHIFLYTLQFISSCSVSATSPTLMLTSTSCVHTTNRPLYPVHARHVQHNFTSNHSLQHINNYDLFSYLTQNYKHIPRWI